MKDYLVDIVKHTQGLGIDLVKITGTATDTTIASVAEDRNVILEAKFKRPMSQFTGVFGLPNLTKLNTILGIQEYRDDAKLTITTQNRNGEDVVAGVHFENKAGDFKNDYRFMSAEIVNEKLKAVKFRGVKWNVDFIPDAVNIQRLKWQAAANSDEITFIAKTDKGQLQFSFGDASSHAGNFIFADEITGTLAKSWSWPVAAVITILGLTGDKTFKISDEGAAMITVDSGLIEYSYIIPAQTK
jgi:hypothetical protein